MAKSGKRFKGRLAFDCDIELQAKVTAVAYYVGDAGQYAHSARNLMTRAVEDFIMDMNKDEKKRWDSLLESARVEVTIRYDEKVDKKRERLARLREARRAGLPSA